VTTAAADVCDVLKQDEHQHDGVDFSDDELDNNVVSLHGSISLIYPLSALLCC